MKNIITFLALMLAITNGFSQNESKSFGFKFTGSGHIFQKGFENTQVLSEIIQKKQEQIKVRVFKNTVIKQFSSSKNSYEKKLNNFATYNYMYNIMDVVTSGNSKTYITKELMSSSTEFAFVFGLAIFSNKDLIENSKVTYSKKGKVILPKSIKEFNILLDLCYDIAITNSGEFETQFNFKESLKNVSFKTWYTNDNAFVKEYKKAQLENDTATIKSLNNQREVVSNKIKELFSLSKNTEDVMQSIKESNFKGAKSRIDKLQDDFYSMTSSEIINEVDGIKSSFGGNFSKKEHGLLDKLKTFASKDFDEFKELYGFYVNLRKSKFEDFSINKTQLKSLKFILNKFIKLSENHHPNNVISSVIGFIIDNTIVEYADKNNSAQSVNSNTSNGFLYIDAESLINKIASHHSTLKKNKFTNYFAPFFSIGTNYASFNHSNNLKPDNASLNNLYFASEKIGFKYKIYNWKYVRAFKPGESFTYYGKHRVWKRPQEQPLIADLHFVVYGSGLLYNVVNTKSEKSFTHPIFGYGAGVTFFNGLSLNISYATPIVNGGIRTKNSFFNIGFDVPIIDYIISK